MIQDPISAIIIWVSPVLGALVVWFINNLISSVKDDIKRLHNSVRELDKELNKTQNVLVKIQTDFDHFINSETKTIKYNHAFESKVATILKNINKRHDK